MKLNNLFSVLLAGLLALAPSGAWAGTTNLDTLSLSGNLSVTGTTTHTGNVTNAGDFAVTGGLTVTGNTVHTGTLLQSGVSTFTLAPVLSTATITASGDTYTVPDVGNASFVMTAGTQTIAGATTFTLSPVLTTATITASGDVYTIPDVGTANFIMSAGTQTVAGATTFTLAPVLTSGTISANGDTNTIPDLGNASFVMTEGTQTINGTKTFGTPLVAASLNNSLKRYRNTWYPASNVAGSTLADGATYKGYIPLGRVSTVTGVFCVCNQVPVGGTNTVKILKASASGNTMLNAASVDPTTFTNNTVASLSLTATGADLGLTAAEGVYVEWVAGTQSTDAVNCGVSVEYTLTDF